MMLILGVVVWLLLVLVQAIWFRPVNVSTFELRRRSIHGDTEAIQAERYTAAIPSLEVLQFIVSSLLATIIISLCIVQFGAVQGIALGVILFLISPFGRRLKIITRFVDAQVVNHRTQLISTGQTLKVALGWLRRRTSSFRPRVYSKEELIELLQHSSNVLSGGELQRLRANLVFESKKVSDIMTPREDIVSVKADDTLGPLVLDELYKTGHTRFPVIVGSLNTVVGVLSLGELLSLRTEHATAQEAMQPIERLAADDTLEKALHTFLRSHAHLFIVEDETTETVGLITLEDIMSAAFGRQLSK